MTQSIFATTFEVVNVAAMLYYRDFQFSKPSRIYFFLQFVVSHHIYFQVVQPMIPLPTIICTLIYSDINLLFIQTTKEVNSWHTLMVVPRLKQEIAQRQLF
jgi:hypothetical protein